MKADERWSGAGVFVDVENLLHHVAAPSSSTSPAVLHPKPSAEDVARGCQRLLERLGGWAGAGLDGSAEMVLVGKKYDPAMVAVRGLSGASTRYAGPLANAADAQLLATLFERASAGRFRRWVVASADGDVVKGFQVAAGLLGGAHARDAQAGPDAQPEFFVVIPPGHGEVKTKMHKGGELSGPISSDQVRALTKLRIPTDDPLTSGVPVAAVAARTLSVAADECGLLTRRSIIETAVGRLWETASRDPLLRRATLESLVSQTQSCVKGLLPVVNRQPHLSRPSTDHLTRVLKVDEPFLVALATLEDDVVLQPAQVQPAIEIAEWAAQIAVSAYRVYVSLRREALISYASHKGLFVSDNQRRSVAGKWLTAVRLTALNLIADGHVDVAKIGELEAALRSLTVEQLWAEHPDFAGRGVVDGAADPANRAIREAAIKLLFEHKQRFFGVMWRTGQLKGYDAEDVLQETGKKILTLPSFGPGQANLAYLTAMVRTLTLDHIDKRRRMPTVFVPKGEDFELIADTGVTDDHAPIIDSQSGYGEAPGHALGETLARTARDEVAETLDALVTAGERQGVPETVLDAHRFVAHKVRSTRSAPLDEAIHNWYEDYYSINLGRPPAITERRVSERLRELRYAVMYRDFPPPDGDW